MRASVYRLRERGLRLPRPKEPVLGNLVLADESKGDLRGLTARLVEATSDMLPPLRDALVTRISTNGLVIKGIEMSSRVPGSIKVRVDTYRQTWWVAVWTEEMFSAYESEDPLDAIDDRICAPFNTAPPHPK